MAQQIERLYNFVNGQKAMAEQVNDELDQLVTFTNGLSTSEETLDNSLESIVDGSSGADKVGATPIVSGGASKVQAILEYLQANKVASADVKAIRINVDNVIEVTLDGITWEATGSSGHIIKDSAGNALPQRSQLQFNNTTVTDDGTKTIVAGLTGPQGIQGIQGVQGVQGPTGATGPKGNSIIPAVNATTGLMTFTEGPAGAVPSAVYVKGPQGAAGVQGPQGVQGVQGNAGPQGDVGSRGLKGDTGDKGDKGDTGATGATGATGPQGPTGPQGQQGDTGAAGTSFAILGLYATLYDLQTAVPIGSAGDAYAVGTQISNVIYNWDVAQAEWVNLGSLQGPIGPQGIQGIQGIQGVAGPEGATGATGAAGEQGPKGDIGKGYYPMGAWAEATPYVNSDTQIDVVFYFGQSYYCKVSHTSSAGVTPVDTSKWGVMTYKGTDGVDGAAGADGLTTSVNGVTQVGGAITLTPDDFSDGITNKVFSATEKTKLGTIAEGATATPVVDNLTSTSTTSALSANQGKVLKSMVDALLDVKTATIGTTWTGSSAPYTQTVSVSGVTAADNSTIVPVYSADNATAILEKTAWSAISKAETGTGNIVFTCFEEKPVTAINIEIIGV